MKMANTSTTHTDSNITAVEEDGLDVAQLYFIAYGFLPPIILAFGLTGNLLTLIVLSRAHFKAVSYTYIRWLSFSDLLAMLIWVPIIVRDGWDVKITNVHAARYYADCHLLLHNTFLASSAFFVVALSVERYVSVCHPAHAQSLITPQRARLVVALIYLVAAIIHIPYVYEEMYVLTLTNETHHNTTVITGEVYTFERNSDIYGDKQWANVFQAYSWVLATVTKFFPILLVFSLNTWTVTAFYRVVEKRQQMAGGSSASRKLREQQRIMIMLICVVVIFVTCLLPMPFLYLFYSEVNLQYYGFHVFRVIANLLETGNSALNFYVYCVASQDFRQHLRLTLAACCGRDSSPANGDIEASTNVPLTTLKGKCSRLALTDNHQQQAQPLLNNEIPAKDIQRCS